MQEETKENLSQEETQEEQPQETPVEETSEEEPIETPEAVKEFLGEEATKAMEEELKETPEEEETEVEEEEETEEEIGTTDEQIPPAEIEAEIPLEEVEEKVREDEREKFKEEILEKLGITDEAKEEAKEEGFKFSWEERGEPAPKDWKEVAEENARFSEWKAEKAREKAEEAAKVKAEQEAERVKKVNAEWDRQLDELRKGGNIPEIAPEIKKKLEDPSSILTQKELQDPGIKAQQELFTTMGLVAQKRRLQGLEPIGDLFHIYHQYIAKDQKPKKPAGATAPVSGGRKAVNTNDVEDLSYEELHNTDLEELAKR